MTAHQRVLIIDDDLDFRVSMRSLLESSGYEVIEADSGAEGLRKVVEDKPDLIFLDIMMENDTEGYSVSYSLRNRDEYASCRDIPIFMISSIEESPDERFAMADEAGLIQPDYYLTKPLDIPRLLELLKSAVPP
jgi:two-component system, OmpR family, KDP operon response regulator KdpE